MRVRLTPEPVLADRQEEPKPPNGAGGDSEAPPEGMAWWGEVARAWGPAILAVLFIRTFVFEPFRIPSGSMIPTLLIGDFVVVNKSAYGVWVPSTGLEIPMMDFYLWVVPKHEVVDLGDPERGDIVVFRYPMDERTTFIKRVVAIPGDTISVKRNQITINGDVQPTDFVSKFSAQAPPPSCRLNTQKLYDETIGNVAHSVLMNPGGGRLADRPEVTVPEDHVFVMGDNRDNSDDSRAWGFVRFDQIKGKAHFVWMSWDGCSGGSIGSLRPDRLFHGLYSN
jgi:signal peptidase I